MADAVVFYNGPIVSRAEAIRDGLKFYFTGKPCINGHIDRRYISKSCVACTSVRGKLWVAENLDRHKEWQKKWNEENKERLAEINRKWQLENKDKTKANNLRWKERNREKYLAARNARCKTEEIKKTRREYDRKRYHEKRKLDPAYRIHMMMRREVARHIKGLTKPKKEIPWEELVGYSKDDLVSRLKQTIPDGYTWQDYLDGKLHLDHITPCVAFNVVTVEDIDFRRCWALSNLQLLPGSENCRKGAKLAQPFQPTLSGI